MDVASHRSRIGGRLPRGPHKLTSEQVASDQRERLVAAMVQLAGERGYAAITVADVIARAEVSRKTFYAHFDERRDLLLAAFDVVSAETLEDVHEAAHRKGGPTRQLESLMRRLCLLARERPGVIALSTVEIAAIVPAGLKRRDALMGSYGELIDECLNEDSKRRSRLPAILARALAGSVHRTIDAQLRAGNAQELASLAPQLARWTRSYHPVPAIGPPKGKDTAKESCAHAGQCSLGGGRAPGTLTLTPTGYRPPTGRRSASFVRHANRERILDAVAQLNAARGYTMLTAQAIAERADVSERAFLAHFKSKDEAFAAALEVGHLKAQAVIERTRAEAPDWSTGVRRAVGALLELLGSEPYFTRMAFVDALLAGQAMALRVHEHAAAYANLLLDGAPQRRRPPEGAAEAIVHGLFELAFHHAVEDRIEELPSQAPLASYLVLAPFLGVTEAARTA